jgi:16S rRNA U1498 N3-methylase RsmE
MLEHFKAVTLLLNRREDCAHYICSMILKKGDKFQVRSKSGRLLGEHRTRKEALAQLRAVEASKKEKSK